MCLDASSQSPQTLNPTQLENYFSPPNHIVASSLHCLKEPLKYFPSWQTTGHNTAIIT